MRRREFITVLGSAATWSLAANAQQVRRIGVLLGFAESDRDAQSGLALFREELRKLGWAEGRNIEMEIHAAGGDVESIKRFAKELVALQPDLIVTSSTPATAAMLQQTRTIPVIFVEVGDPIGSGFVMSLAQPGGNVTGFTPIVGSLGGKWVEVLRDIVPRADSLVQVIVTRLEARGKHPLFQKMLQDYLDAMQIDEANIVIDLGCGTGVAARAIARRHGFSGRVLGIDLSPALAQKAAQLAANEGLDSRVEFRSGDSRKLDLADGTFDAVVAHTLVSHVDDPLAVLREAARLVRPGGMIGIFDGDYASITFGNVDPTKGKAYDEAIIGGVVTSPRVMRQMPHLLQAADLQLIASFPYVIAEVGKADFWAPAIESFRRLVPKSGAMTEQEANAWADGLLGDSAAGVFFGASNYYGYVARRSRA